MTTQSNTNERRSEIFREDLPKVRAWIRNHCRWVVPRKGCWAYLLKSVMEQQTGVFVTNSDFALAALVEGYEIVEEGTGFIDCKIGIKVEMKKDVEPEPLSRIQQTDNVERRRVLNRRGEPSDAHLDRVRDWIRRRCFICRSCNSMGSYNLKHRMAKESDDNFYVTDETFIAAALLEGYKATEFCGLVGICLKIDKNKRLWQHLVCSSSQPKPQRSRRTK